MPRFQPRVVLDTLNSHGVRYVIIGGVAATLHGSPLRTGDTDVCPDVRSDNLDRLAAALRDLHARIRTEGAEGGLPFACDAAFLSRVALLNLETDAGDLDVSFTPAGTNGYDDLVTHVATFDLDGVVAPDRRSPRHYGKPLEGPRQPARSRRARAETGLRGLTSRSMFPAFEPQPGSVADEHVAVLERARLRPLQRQPGDRGRRTAPCPCRARPGP